MKKKIFNKLIALVLVLSIGILIFTSNSNYMVNSYTESWATNEIGFAYIGNSTSSQKTKAIETKKATTNSNKSALKKGFKNAIDELDKTLDAGTTFVNKLNDDDTSTKEKIQSGVELGIVIASSCFGFGEVANSALELIHAIWPDDPETISASEVEIFGERLSNEISVVNDNVNLAREDIQILSNNLDESTSKIISEIENIGETTVDIERIYNFFSNDDMQKFNYSSFNNVMLGSDNSKENYKYGTAYNSQLLTALTGDIDTTELYDYYNNLYTTLKNDPTCRLQSLYDNYLLEDNYTNKKTIIVSYYNYLQSNSDLISDDETAESMAYDFACELNDLVYYAEKQYLISCAYVDSDNYKDESNAVVLRLQEFENQLIKDISYILSQDVSYFILSQDGYGNDYTREVLIDEKIGYGKALDEDIIYLNTFPAYILNDFEITNEQLKYYVNGELNDGYFTIDSSKTKEYKIEYKYDNGTEEYLIYEMIIKVPEDNDSEFLGGTGYFNDPYVIANANQFKRINENLDASYILVNDISLTSSLDVIGYDNDKNHSFNGIFDGNGFKINIKNVNNEKSFYGIFGYNNGLIENCTIESSNIDINVSSSGNSQTFYCGLLVGYNVGTIYNVHVKNSSITATQDNSQKNTCPCIYVGGICGCNTGTIQYCSVSQTKVNGNSLHDYGGEVPSSNINSVYAGGVVGLNKYILKYIYVDSLSSITTNVVSRIANSNKVNIYINSYAGEIYALNKGKCENLNTGNPSLNAQNDSFYKDGNYLKTNNSETYKDWKPLWYTTENVGFYEGKIDRKEVKIEDDYKNENLNIQSVKINYTYNVDVTYKNFIQECGDTDIDENNFIVNINNETINYDKGTGNIRIIGEFGFSPYNSDFENLKTSSMKLIVSINYYDTLLQMNREIFTMVDIDQYWIGTNYAKEIVEKNIESLRIDDNDNILLNGSITIQYADNSNNDEAKNTIVNIINSKFYSNGNEIDGKINKIYSEDGLFVGTIKCMGISDTLNSKITCDHIYDETNSELWHDTTCCEAGYKICSKCGYKCYEGFDSVEDHIQKRIDDNLTQIINNVSATCEHDGSTGDCVCTMCGYILEKGTLIKKLDHNYICSEDGNTHHCDGCSSIELNHEYTIKEKIEYDSNGIQHTYYEYVCVGCGHIYEDTVTITDTAKAQPQVIVSNAYVLKTSKTAKVYIQVKNNPGFDGTIFTINYDTRLKYTGYEEGSLWKNSYFKNDTTKDAIDNNNGSISFSWTSLNTNSSDGTLLVLYFDLPDVLEINEDNIYNIEIVYKMANDVMGGFSSSNDETLLFVPYSGYVKVVEHLPGDVNDDGVVDIKDMVAFSNYCFYDKTEAINDGFNLEYADVNLDCIYNTTDLVNIMKYIVGGYGIDLLLPDFSIKLNPTGGNINCDEVFVSNGSDANFEVPTRDGYTFVGWYKTLIANDNDLYGETVKYNSNQYVQTLYAKWEVNSITFKGNSFDLDEIIIRYDGNNKLVSYDNSISTESKFKREYLLSFVDEKYNMIANTDKVQEINYTLLYFVDAYGNRYYLNHEFDISSNSYILEAVWDEPSLSLPDISLTGYTLGWYLNQSGAGDVITNLSNIIDIKNDKHKQIINYKGENKECYYVYAIFKANEYKVTFMLNDPGNKNNQVSDNGLNYPYIAEYTYDGKDGEYDLTSSIFNPILNGYSFTGWFSDENYSKKIYDLKNLSSVNGDNVVLYAGWTNNIYTVNINNILKFNDDLEFVNESITLYEIFDIGFSKTNDYNSILIDKINLINECNGYLFKGVFEYDNNTSEINFNKKLLDENLNIVANANIVNEDNSQYVGYWEFNNYGIEYELNIDEDNNLYFIVKSYNSNYSEVVIHNYIGRGDKKVNVTVLGKDVFNDCENLECITIPGSITKFELSLNSNGDSFGNQFNNCNNLKSVYYTGENLNQWMNIDFGMTHLKNSIYCETGNPLKNGANLYINNRIINNVEVNENTNFKALCSWKSLNSITFNSSLTEIPTDAFYCCSGLIDVEIPSTIQKIEKAAFYGCNSIINITIPFIGNVNDATTTFGYIFGSVIYNEFVPSSIEKVTILNGNISQNAFRDCSSIKEIIIPDNATKIYYASFLDCVNLKTIVIPASVSDIACDAFSGCSSLESITVDDNNSTYNSKNNCNAIIRTGTYTLIRGCKNTTIPNTVTIIGAYSFSGCSDLVNVILPSGVKTIERYSFSDCYDLESILISKNVSSIDRTAFNNCDNLTNISVDKDNSKYDSRENCNGIILTESNTLYMGFVNTVIPNTVTSIGEDSFYKLDMLTTLIIPESVTTIDQDAFNQCYNLNRIIVDENNTVYDSRDNCNAIITTESNTLTFGFKNSTIPNTVKTIGKYSFENCKGLTNIVIPSSVTKIESYAFTHCSSLTGIIIPSSVKSIGSDSFSYCTSLVNVDIQEGLTYIESLSFYYCTSLKSINIPNSVKSIGASAFGYCSGLTNITIPNSVKVIYSRAFSKCTGLTNVTIPSSVETIDSYAFSDCTGLITITIPNNVTTLGDYAFSGCTGLTSIILGTGINKIGNYTFNKCSNLANITIPENVITIGQYAFNECNKLTNITIPSNVCTIDSYAFYNCAGLQSLIIQSCSTKINSYAFYLCKALNEVNLTNGITTIETYAFGHCESLTSIEIPSSVTSIGQGAFAYCKKLASIVVDENNTIYDSRDNCNAIITTKNNILLIGCINTIIPSTVKTIDKCAFKGSGIVSIVIPNNIYEIPGYAFSDCNSLKNVTFVGGKNSIGTGAFHNCISLTNIEIPLGVQIIYDYTFDYCINIKSIIIPSTVTSIYSLAFRGCDNLTDIYYTGTEEQWIKIASKIDYSSYNIHCNYVE